MKKKVKILIVEDDKTADLLLTVVLQEFADELLHAVNGIDAVNICRNNPDIDFLVMDVKMPEMDGYEAARQIRLFNKNVIIIAQTAYVVLGEKERALRSGCNDFLPKPIRIADLMTLLDTYLQI